MQDSLEDFIKLTRNVKQEEPPKISQQIQITAQFKNECDSRAMRIVEFAIEGKLRPEVFLKCLPFINQGHYQDIVEERSITKLCGYPVCGKKVPDMPKKQYFISSKSNKVYDITERKNFCSNFCYKASLHIKKQIDTSPLWLRKLEDIPDYSLLPTTESGLPGEYIDQGIVKPVATVEQNFTPISSFAEVGLTDLIDKEIKPDPISRDRPKSFKKSSKLKNTMQTINENEVIQEQQNKTKVQSKTNKAKKEVKESVKNEVATCMKDVHKKGAVINLPAIQENEEQKENSDKNKLLEENVQKQTELKENINSKNKIGKIQTENPDKVKEPAEDRLKIIDFVNKIEEILPPKTDLSSTKKDLIHDIKSVANNPLIKNKSIQENQDTKMSIMFSKKATPQSTDNETNKSKTKLIGPKLVTVSEVKENKDKAECTKIIRKESKTSTANPDLKLVLKNVLNSWLTLDTCIFIHGESKVKEILTEHKMSDYFEELNVIDLRREQQMKYMAICRKLQFQEMADDKFDKSVTESRKLEPLPDYSQLKQEAKDLTLKVKCFLQGEMYEEEDKNFPSKINKKEDEENEPPAVLPPVDSNNQTMMRRKIFLGSLNRAMHQLLKSLGISYYSTVLSDLPGLAKTFTLKADNITFKPATWHYVALVLLHMLALRDVDVKKEIEDPRAQEYIRMLCEEVSPDEKDFISDILSDVRDIELFVRNYIEKADM